MDKVSANVRRLVMLLREYTQSDAANGHYDYFPIAAFLARRGVLAVCAATVNQDDAAILASSHTDTVIRKLRRLARAK